jgi:putative ABC transport system permease protein
MEFLYADIKQAFRVLRKSPGFTITAVAALALGIGANTAIFSVVDSVLLKPLPYPDSDRLVSVGRTFKTGFGDSISIPKFNVWRQENRAFDAMTAYDFGGPGMNMAGGDVPEQVKAIHTTYEYFHVFGVKAQMGRTYTAAEDRPGTPKVVVISDGLWKRRFGGDPAIVGRNIILSGEPYTVVGVLTRAFQPDPPSDVWIPLQPDPNSTNQGHYLVATGRLKPGVTLDQAKAQLKVIGERFRAQYPDWMGKEEGVGARTLQEATVGNMRTSLLVLVGAVCFVLLIACANVANLLLARATGRQREIAIRSAIGAGRARIIGQLLTESVVLSICGGVIGLLLGSVGVRALLAVSPGNVPRVEQLAGGSALASALDWRVVFFTFGVALITGILFGLVPALQVSRADLNSTLKEGSGRSGTGLRHNRMRSFLVVGETAMALVLLVGAVLLIRTFVGLKGVNSGIDTGNVLTLQLSMAGGRYSTADAMDNFDRQVTERLESIPGVQGATMCISMPLQQIGVDLPFTIAGQPLPNGEKYHGDEFWRNIGPNYFNVFKIGLLRGRVFDKRDTRKAPQVIIVNDTFAKKYFAKQDPIGRQILVGKDLGPDFADAPRQVVGIVTNVREGGLDQDFKPVMYVPTQQGPEGMSRLANQILPMTWAVRTAGDPFALTEAVRREIQAVDGQMPVAKFKSMEQLVRVNTARQNFNMMLLTIFAAIALLLAAIGLYGLMAYSVEQRKQEIGIRLALGAAQGDVTSMIVRQGMLLAGAGVIVGLGAAYGLTRLLASLLYGVKPYDPLTFGGVAVILSLVALLASYIPARRAMRIDPVIALRYQ